MQGRPLCKGATVKAVVVPADGAVVLEKAVQRRFGFMWCKQKG